MDREQTIEGMPVIEPSAVAELGSRLRGELLRPGNEGYESARKVWNGMIDRHPALIVRCTGAADVIRAVRFARERGLLVSVRGGGHSVAGSAVCDGGMVVDLSGMRGVRVDPEARVARAEPGLTWGGFDNETQAFGLATTGGLVSETGIAGLTLGGGIGWLMRSHGLTEDNLVSADIVTAEGEFVTAGEHRNEDLFWGIRGGGGNFGIVTSFEYRLHPVGSLLGGLMIWPIGRARQLLRLYRDWVTTIPDELTTLAGFLTAPPAPSLPQDLRGKRIVAVAVCYEGPAERGEEWLRPLRQFGPPAADLIQPMPYIALQRIFDASAPAGLQNYWKSEYLPGLGDEAIDTIIGHATRTHSPLTQVHIHHMGGAISRVGRDETAFAYRDVPFALNIVATWSDPADSERHIRWARDFWEAMLPHSSGGVYVNFLGEEEAERVRTAYGESYERLVALKDKYDPTNFFRMNQNIPPHEHGPAGAGR